jgi:RNA polymerase sigma factor (TIGR02999 family)
MGDVTTLLAAARRGQAGAVDRLYTLLYQQLRAAARRQLRRRDHRGVLDTTMVVHESYLRLKARGALSLTDRLQFMGYAASAMRSVIVDLARSQLAEKRGSGAPVVTLRTGIAESVSPGNEDILRVHEALDELAAIEPRLAKIVEMRYFVGMSEQEAAAALGIARRTAQRDWEKARLFLFAALRTQ